MTRMFRRFARLLVVAGGCGLASFSLCAAPTAALGGVVAPMNVTPGQAQLEAMKVEVGLLGDSTTMRLPLTVVPQTDCILVKGLVPDEAARRRVIEVARQSCYLPIQDGMTVRTAAMADAAALKKSARDTLVRQMGSKADRLVLTASEDGQVKLEGDVASIEEK